MKLLLKLLIAMLCLGFIATLSLRPDVLMRFKQDGLKAFLPKSAPNAPTLPSILPKALDTKPQTPAKSDSRKQLYRWQDEKGQWHFTDVPPPHATSAEQFSAPHPEQNVLSFESVREQARAQEAPTPSAQNRVHIVGEDSSQNTSNNLKDSPALQGIRDMEKRQAEQQKILDQL